jgi:hypothetical protein
MISNISYNQQEILNNILTLHVPNKQIDADPTYSKGNFYKKGVVPQPKFKFDLYPQTPDTVQASSDNLPVLAESFDCVVFDPLFVSGCGPSNNSIIRTRFCALKTMKDVWEYYERSLSEIYRTLKPNGILIFKCMDTVSAGKQHWSHCEVLKVAEKIGFYGKDLFVLLAKSRLSNWKTQIHARKFNSYFWVLQKPKRGKQK